MYVKIKFLQLFLFKWYPVTKPLFYYPPSYPLVTTPEIPTPTAPVMTSDLLSRGQCTTVITFQTGRFLFPVEWVAT